MSSQQRELLTQSTDALTTLYGAFLRISDLAKVLKTSPESLQNTLRTSRQPAVRYIRAHRRRFGRRVYFPAVIVAEALILHRDELLRRLDGSSA